MNWIDPLGLLTEVVVWQPVGHTDSSFGHVSVNINGTTYNFTPGGMSLHNTQEYVEANFFRDGIGSELNLSPCEEKELEEYLKKFEKEYFWPITTCTTPVQEGLKKLGHDVGINLHPVSLGHAIIDSGLVTKINFYEATQPRTDNAPWAK